MNIPHKIGAQPIISTLHLQSNKTGGDTIKADSSSSHVSLSEAAQALAQADKVNTERINNFLADNGKVLYEITIKSMKTYPEDLAARLEPPDNLTNEEISDMTEKLRIREFEAFGKYAKQSPPDYISYHEKYVEYLDSLSPTEQTASRYVGTRTGAVQSYERLSREAGQEPDDLSYTQDPTLMLFDFIAEADFNITDSDRFLQEYEHKVSQLLNRESGERFIENKNSVVERFTALDKVIQSAKDGDDEAFKQLGGLVKGRTTLDKFVEFSLEVEASL